MWQYIGVDWDSGGWLAVGISDAKLCGAAVFTDITALWRELGSAASRIVIDVPIGLCESVENDAPDGFHLTDGQISRICDDLARPLLGRRSSSVFTTPCRSVVRKAGEGAPYKSLNAENRRCTGKGLSVQAKGIASGIDQVDRFLIDGGEPERLLEGHPELAFRALAQRPLKYAKTCAQGIAERLAILESSSEYEHGDWRRLASILAEEQDHKTGMDDLLDAMVLAITAAAPEGHFHSLPENPPSDAKGLPMQMVYRRTQPFGER